ncbi:MAG TPA: CsbD family protein [Candidatus Binatia bacterium]
MNQDIASGQWRQMRGALKSWWGKLSDDDLEWVGGEKDKLIGLLQQKYGQTRDEAAQEVEWRLNQYSSETGATIAGITAKAQELGANASAKVKDAVDSAKSYLQEKNYSELTDDLTDVVRRYPVPSLLVGIGIGYLLARSMRD